MLSPSDEENIGQEQDNGLCYVMRGHAYPRLRANPSTLLGTFLSSIRPDPFEPIVVAPFAPDGGRTDADLDEHVTATSLQLTR